jgi:multisubunit Na+/H+ antiporter MnhB subunit
MSEGLTDRKSKASELAIDGLKQLLTLASAVLALTIAFIKDALGPARDKAAWTFLVPVAWGFLAIVIWTAWVAIPDACRKMAEEPEYVFANGRPKVLAMIAQWFFVIGLTLLTVFAVINFKLFFVAQETARSAVP